MFFGKCKAPVPCAFIHLQQYMDFSFLDNDKTPCWVYISEIPGNTYLIGFSLTLPEGRMSGMQDGEHIVWICGFHGVANALACKLFLESISLNAIKSIVTNPVHIRK